MREFGKKVLWDRQKINKVSTYIILSMFIIFAMIFGVLLDIWLKTNVFFTILFFIFSIFQILFGLSLTGSFIIKLLDAKRLGEENLREIIKNSTYFSDPEYIKNIIDEVKRVVDCDSDIEVFVIPSQMINALLVGRTKHDYKLCLTYGTIEKLPLNEFKALLYHEFFHIITKDTEYLTTVSGTFGSPMLLFKLSSNAMKNIIKSKNKVSNMDFYRDFIIFSFICLVSVLFLPLSLLTNFFISVRKEFDADMFSVNNVGKESMISLLKKIKESCQSLDTSYFFMRHLFFSHPNCKDITNKVNKAIETYPTIDERIEFIEKSYSQDNRVE